MNSSIQTLKSGLLALGIGIAVSSLFVPRVGAQVPGSTSTIAVAATEVNQLALGWSVKRSLLGKSLYNDSGDKVGKVQDLIIAPDKSASFLIVAVGGFIGIASRDVAVPVSQLRQQDNKLVLPGATKDALKAMPQFNYASDTTRRAQFTSQAEQDLAAARQQAAELRKKAASTTGNARQVLDTQLAGLDDDIKAAEARLNELRQASAAKWHEFENKVSDALARVKESLHRATA